MGGAVRGEGNTGLGAEFNIEIDPEAARIVFESGVPVAMVPLEVTHTGEFLLACPASGRLSMGSVGHSRDSGDNSVFRSTCAYGNAC